MFFTDYRWGSRIESSLQIFMLHTIRHSKSPTFPPYFICTILHILCLIEFELTRVAKGNFDLVESLH